MNKIIILILLICLIYTPAYCDGGDDHNIGSAYVMVAMMVVMTAGYFLYHRHHKRNKQSAQKMINEQYIRGEISTTQYFAKKQTLKKDKKK